jgi:hypothetical protein
MSHHKKAGQKHNTKIADKSPENVAKFEQLGGAVKNQQIKFLE